MNKEQINSLLIKKSRDLAVRRLMDQNGFTYINDNVQSNDKIMMDYHRTGVENGMFSFDHKYVHINDNETMVDGRFYGVYPLLESAMAGEPIDSYNYEYIKTIKSVFLNGLNISSLAAKYCDNVEEETCECECCHCHEDEEEVLDEEVEDTLEKLKDDIKNELTVSLKKEIIDEIKKELNKDNKNTKHNK